MYCPIKLIQEIKGLLALKYAFRKDGVLYNGFADLILTSVIIVHLRCNRMYSFLH
jgi:hypothetical protein